MTKIDHFVCLCVQQKRLTNRSNLYRKYMWNGSNSEPLVQETAHSQ